MAKNPTPEDNAPETDAPETDAPRELAPAPAFRRKAAVIRPLLKLVENVPVFVKIEGPIYMGEKVDEKKDPAHLANVINLETGEQALIVCPKLLVDALAKNYADDSYVGKAFEVCIKVLKKSAGGNNFRPVELYEIEA